MNETLNDIVIGNTTNASAIGDESLEPQFNCRPNIFGRITVGENIACQIEVVENNIDDKIGKPVDSAVMTVKNWIRDAILKAMDNVEIPRVEMAMRSITESSGRGPRSVVQDPDQRSKAFHREY